MEETEYAFLRSRGLSVVLDDGRGVIGFPRVSARATIEIPLTFDDTVEIELDLVKLDGKQIVYNFRIINDGQIAATGTFKLACCRFPPDKFPYAILVPDFITSALLNETDSSMTEISKYDAIIVVSFGGPDCADDVIPFLENVLRGKNVPHERMMEVAEHYHHLGSASPINEHVRELISALENELREHDIALPIYSGNRNWHPMLPDTLQKMKDDGITRALAFYTSAYSSYSGCRQYSENVIDARATVGQDAPTIDRLRMFFNHPLFIEASADRVEDALNNFDETRRSRTRVVFTAHSIPISMADGCDYTKQLDETCRLIMENVGANDWDLVYQSRSGPPSQPWLEPDVCDFLEQLKYGN